MRRLLLVVLVLAAGTAVRALVRPATFDHVAHAGLFPTCTSCHEGITRPDASLWPTASQCAACHDGTVAERVTWTPPTARPASNLRFTHETHRAAAGDTIACADCHTRAGEPTEIRWASARRCVACHGFEEAHLAIPATACATCHVRLADAALTESQIAEFSEPPSHERSDFGLAHADQVDQACSTCHAQEFCTTCHVNAAAIPAIAELGSNPRSTVLAANVSVPPGHADPGFLTDHGRSGSLSCATCHTQSSCTDCHRNNAPPDHTRSFTDWRHGPSADAATLRCATCHVRNDCLDCHRPGPGSGAYHPADFLARHPAAAYGRETSCSDCHNPAGFCASCHQMTGLTSRGGGVLRGGYHDGQPAFLVGHGPSARRSLESCVSCHTETDCLTCHSSVRGRGFNPHGADFNAERLRRRNPEMCIVCHGVGIPGG